MRRLDWETDDMLGVYYDIRIVVTSHSRWFFAHMLPSCTRASPVLPGSS